MKEVVIYTGDLCIHCDWARELLNRKKIKFTEYNVAQNTSKREEMFSKSNGAKTVPQIFIGEHHVGGNIELQALEKEGKLNSLLGTDVA
tara:strand:- start:306 stop:572 length:267 start_codon:yes stop_codon:yes gene_type:complete